MIAPSIDTVERASRAHEGIADATGGVTADAARRGAAPLAVCCASRAALQVWCEGESRAVVVHRRLAARAL